jgi:hypothetical protein
MIQIVGEEKLWVNILEVIISFVEKIMNFFFKIN